MTKFKKIALSVLSVLTVLSVVGFVGCSSGNGGGESDKIDKIGRQADIGLPDNAACNVGEVFVLPVPVTQENVLSYKIEVKKNDDLVAELTEDDGAYTFDTSGEYSLVYNAETEKEILVDNFTLTVSGGGAFAIDWLPESVGRFETVKIVDVYKNIDGQSVKADLTITSPSGRAVTPKDGIVEFTEEGNWTFEFSAGSGSGKITETKTVAARLNSSDLFSFTSGGVKKADAVSVPAGMGARDNPLNAKGVELTFKGDGVIRFNNMINLNDLSAADSLIELYAIPASVPDYTGYTEEVLPGEQYASGGYTHGTANFTKFEIKLTDAYDPGNVIIITFDNMPTLSYWNWNEGYINVGNKKVVYAINDGKLVSGLYGDNDTGTVGSYSFYGEGNFPFNVQLDYASKRFYSKTRGKDQVLVLDYSDASKLGAANVWNGFTTGECYMELSFPTVAKESSILITKILGVSLDGEKPADTKAPKIEIDCSDFENENAPTAKVGAAYKVPSATAFDELGGKFDLSVIVEDPNGESVDVTSGKFVPSVIGNYSIVYSSKDFYGNSATKTLTVSAVEALEDIVVSPVSEYEFYAGEDAPEPKFTISGGSGRKQYTVGYYLNGKELKPTDGWLSFNETGTLEIKFTVTDYFGSYEKTETYEVNAPDKPVLSDVVLPYALYVGKEYQFPKANAYDYKNESFADVDIFVNGAILGKDRKYTPQESDGKQLTVTYSAAANGALETKSYNVKVIDYNISSHMAFEGDVTTEVGSRYTTISAEKDYAISFAYPIVADGLKFSIGGVQGKDKFASIKFTVKDAGDARKTVSFSLEKISSRKFNVVIGEETYPLDFEWVNTVNENRESVVVIVSGGNVEFRDGNLVLLGSCPIKNWDNETEFSGFTSGGAYLTVKVNGIYAPTSVKLFGFGNQTYAKSSMLSAPSVALLGELKSGVVALKDKVSLPKAVGFSAISYSVSVTYEVTDPNGNVVRSGKGTDTGSFVCNKYGRYICVYTIYDEVNGVSAQQTFYFDVRDTVEPAVTADENLGTAKVGSSFTIKKAAVSDNSGSDKCVVRVFVVDTYYNSTDITASMKYTPTKSGRYKVVYMAMDEAGNIGVAVSYFTAQ